MISIIAGKAHHRLKRTNEECGTRSRNASIALCHQEAAERAALGEVTGRKHARQWTCAGCAPHLASCRASLTTMVMSLRDDSL